MTDKNEIADAIDNAGDALTSDPNAILVVTEAKKHIPANVRNVIYWTGIGLGALAAVGGAVVASLTGDAAAIGTTVVGVAYSLSNLLAKLNLGGS